MSVLAQLPAASSAEETATACLDGLDALLAEVGLLARRGAGLVTFVDAGKVRRKRDPGRCFRRAGFAHVGHTAGGLVTLQILADAMPEAVEAIGTPQTLAVSA